MIRYRLCVFTCQPRSSRVPRVCRPKDRMLSPPPSRIRKHSKVLNQDRTRVFICFCTARHPELQVLVFHKTLLEGWVPYFALHGHGGLVLSCSKLASDRHAPLDVPAKGTTAKLPALHRHDCRDVPLAEVSHSCVVTCGMGIMSPNHRCCCTNCVFE